MTCELVMKANKMRTVSGLAFGRIFAVAILATLGCDEKIDITIVGEVRDPANDCEPILVDYHYRIEKRDTVPQIWNLDWCAVMGGSKQVTCFLNSNNPQRNTYLKFPEHEPHTRPESSHPDLDCWKDEQVLLVGEYEDYSSGEAGSSPDEDDPLLNNDE